MVVLAEHISSSTLPGALQYMSPHMGAKDELYLLDNHGKPTTQYHHN